MDFYWHYSSKELIDPAGKANFFKAIGVASQVFNTLSEVIQGPCTQNQQALAHSRFVPSRKSLPLVSKDLYRVNFPLEIFIFRSLSQVTFYILFPGSVTYSLVKIPLEQDTFFIIRSLFSIVHI